MRTTWGAAALLLLLTASACSDGGSPAPAAPAPVPSSAPTPTTAGSQSPTPGAVPTGSPAQDGDVDGDGELDRVETAGGRLTIALSGSGRTVAVRISSTSSGAAGYLGSHDVDRDGRAEVFLQTGQGASTTLATPYRYDGSRLHEVTIDGERAQLGIGGGALHGDGFRCLPSGLLQVSSAESQDGERFTVRTRLYRLETAALVLQRETTVEAQLGDPQVTEAYLAGCGSLSDGG